MVTRTPDKIIRHPEFKSSTLNNDICLLYIKEPISFDQETTAACLPGINAPQLTGSETDIDCYIAGWGRTSESGQISTILQELKVPIINHSICSSEEVYGNNVNKKTMFCAGYLEGGKDGCQGDSGGPLICIEEQQPVLRGVVSWGIGCARPNSPGVYARTSNYIPWIMNNINSHKESAGIHSLLLIQSES